jgi:hypothetical protein
MVLLLGTTAIGLPIKVSLRMQVKHHFPRGTLFVSDQFTLQVQYCNDTVMSSRCHSVRALFGRFLFGRFGFVKG